MSLRLGYAGKKVSDAQCEAIIIPDCSEAERELWLAARKGDLDRVEDLLSREPALNVNYIVRYDQIGDVDNQRLVYKGRAVSCGPLHAAAALPMEDGQDEIAGDWQSPVDVDFFGGGVVRIFEDRWQPETGLQEAQRQGATFVRRGCILYQYRLDGSELDRAFDVELTDEDKLRVIMLPDSKTHWLLTRVAKEPPSPRGARKATEPGSPRGQPMLRAETSKSLRVPALRQSSSQVSGGRGGGSAELSSRCRTPPETYKSEGGGSAELSSRCRTPPETYKSEGGRRSRLYTDSSSGTSLLKQPKKLTNKSRKICELLLKHKAEVDKQAMIITSSSQRHLQAIHIAAGTGNAATVRLLLENEADPNAATLLNTEEHYYPIHDAAWLNREECMRVLLSRGADLDQKNSNNENVLHLAARFGYTGLVRMIFAFAEDEEHIQDLLDSENNQDAIPLDLALKRGYFPLSDIQLLTQRLNHTGRLRAWKSAADYCPSAISHILRKGADEEEEEGWNASSRLGLIPEWRQSILDAAQSKDDDTNRIMANDLARLVELSPDAALCLIDILTITPEVTDKEHNPLPVRAKIPSSSLCQITCEYELSMTWDWTEESDLKRFNKAQDNVYREYGMNLWQQRLAPPNPRKGKSVKVRVFTLKGLVDWSILYGLGGATDPRIFSNAMVHALLNFSWGRLRWLHYLELLHQVLTIAALSLWIFIYREFNEKSYVSRAVWSCVASHGVRHLLQFFLSCGEVWWKLSFKKCRLEAMMSGLRLVFGTFSLALVFALIPDFHPVDESLSGAVLLGLNCVFHCVHLLLLLRAFEKTGYKLLPVIYSMATIAQMLLLMGILLLGFWLGFSALEPESVGDMRFFQIYLFVITGEPFIEGEGATFMRILGLMAILVFLTCFMNVFIAVLGDSYDLQQEKMLSTFMVERARICSSLLMGASHQLGICVSCLGLTAAIGLIFVGGVAVEAATLLLLPCGGIQLLMAAIVHFQKDGWQDRYLWFCHETNYEERMTPLDNGDVGEVGHTEHGRISRIKRSIFEVKRSVHDHTATFQNVVSSQKQDVHGLRESLAEVHRKQESLDGKYFKMDEKCAEMNERCAEMSENIEKITKILEDARDRKRSQRQKDKAAADSTLARPPEQKKIRD